VTDTDAGVEEGEGVTQEEVFRVFQENVTRMRQVVLQAIQDLPLDRACPCCHAVVGLSLPFALP